MKKLNWLQSAAVAVASIGTLMPNAILAAGPRNMTTPAAVEAPAVTDVALAEGGVLRGQVVDAQGVAVGDAAVTVHTQAGEVARTMTDRDGNFAISGLKGGSYTIWTGETGGQYRLWNAQTAPPVSAKGVLLVRGTTTRGQDGNRFSQRERCLIMLSVLGGIVAAGIVSQDHEDRKHGS